jgi:uncharacterized membrane protein
MNYFTPVLAVHIAAGFTALLTGLVAIISRKGQRLHHMNGKIYFWSMLTVAISAAIMSLMKDLDFFLMLSVFSFYSAYSGFMAIRNKPRSARWLDWLMLTGAIITCGFMISSGNIILIVFGSIFTLFCLRDVRDFLKKESHTIRSMHWLVIHIARMLAAYIATTTAFVVVNFGNILSGNWHLVVWLGPTAIGVPLIFYWINRYLPAKKKSLEIE